jgi:hypothetical protein
MDAPEKAKVSASIIFKNLNTILTSGFFPGNMSQAVAEAIRFTAEVAAKETELEVMRRADEKRKRKGAKLSAVDAPETPAEGDTPEEGDQAQPEAAPTPETVQ